MQLVGILPNEVQDAVMPSRRGERPGVTILGLRSEQSVSSLQPIQAAGC